MALGGACGATVGLGIDGATVGWWQMGWGDAMGREAEKASEFPVAAVAAQEDEEYDEGPANSERHCSHVEIQVVVTCHHFHVLVVAGGGWGRQYFRGG